MVCSYTMAAKASYLIQGLNHGLNHESQNDVG